MPLSFQPQVQFPPSAFVDRFTGPMLATLGVWWVLGQLLPIEVTSWWRSVGSNREAGGSQHSQHLVGTAMDAISPGLTRAQLLPLVTLVASYTGATVPKDPSATSGRSVHVQGLPAGAVATMLRRDPTMISDAMAFVGPPQRTI